MVPVNVFDERTIAEGVNSVVKELSPDVVRIRFGAESDIYCNPWISFRIVLSNRAAREDRLYDVVKKVEHALVDRIRPVELGLMANFRFRSVAEQASLREASWA